MSGFAASAYDIAPTILHLYGIEPPPQMQGHFLADIYENGDQKQAAKLNR
jgi:arylsulfatase A-like enzyme